MFVLKPFTLLPTTRLLFETNITTIKSGGETTPFITAVQKSADIGLMPTKFIDMPIRVEARITA